MRISRLALIIVVLVLVAAGLTAVFAGGSKAQASAHPITTISIKQAEPYTPKAPPGATDDYHCTVMNPHVKQNSYIISSQFFPGSPEDHHAILFLVPPDLAAKAEADNVGNKGWSCFGETPIPNTGLGQISNTPWLSAWAPGHGLDNLPKGTGILLPAGSLVVMQVHYNLLVGDKPVKNSLVLHTVPATTPLLPLKLDLLPAPPDIPCPAGVTGPLCNRTASLANLGQRFGQSAVGFVNTLETICGRNPADPPARRLHVVLVADLQQRLHRQGRSPHAPAGRHLQDGSQSGHARSEDDSRRPRLQLPLPARLQPEDTGCSEAR